MRTSASYRGIFEGRAALVTGGAAGIGKALCEALAAAGADVWLTDRDGAAAHAAAAALQAQAPAGTVRAQALDVTDAVAFAKAARTVQETSGLPVDFLFNNAGMGLAGEVHETRPEDWRRVMEVNLWGVLNGVEAVYGGMRARGRGWIVNVASGAALVPRPGMAAYAASKAAVLALSVSMRAEAAAQGVKVCCVCPGPVATDITRTTTYRGVDPARLLKKAPVKGISAQACAREALDGVAQDRAIIPITGILKVEWLLYRLCPPLVDRLSALRARAFRESRG
jgi:short-subunit dehydrogenase